MVTVADGGRRLAPAPTHRVSLGLAPALRCSSIFRFQKEARNGTLRFISKWGALGGVARFESRLFVAYLVTTPEAVQHILLPSFPGCWSTRKGPGMR